MIFIVRACLPVGMGDLSAMGNCLIIDIFCLGCDSCYALTARPIKNTGFSVREYGVHLIHSKKTFLVG